MLRPRKYTSWTGKSLAVISQALQEQSRTRKILRQEFMSSMPLLAPRRKPSKRISDVTSAYETRLPAVCSLAPSPQHNRIAGGVPPTSTALQTLSQQHYGPAQSRFLVPESLYRLDRPPSGTLPAAQAARSEHSLTSRSIAGRNPVWGSEKAHEGEPARDVYESKHGMTKNEAHEKFKGDLRKC